MKKGQKNPTSKLSSTTSSESHLTIRSLQNSLNLISNQFESLKDEKFILKQRVKSKIFANSETNAKNMINDHHLKNFINSKTSIM